MASYYNFKKVQAVPTGPEFIDIVLSKINRKTPTVIHPNYQISRIRSFYMRKEIHPFYADLMNVLYDRDHYKLALAQLNTARHLIDNVAKDYARLLKFGDSLFRCKQLKKAALGRMATIMKRQKDSLAYLEQVRMHLARLPSIDPNTRTLIVCGYPNVGKSSFMNKVTRADVEVQPYAFTTKSLFVGHMDYKYLRWQVIDTPGILDHPLEQRNTIEMQSVTALAHLRACVLFFIDISEQCGYSVKEQVSLFDSIKPLFANKPVMVVVNKIDIKKPEDLDDEQKELLDSMVADQEVSMALTSCYTEEGVMDVRNIACDKLLAARVEQKLKGTKIQNVINKLHLAQPVARDDRERPAFIPQAALNRMKYDPTDPNRPRLAKDIEAEHGGAGVYNVDLKANYILSNDDWKYDVIPEIMDGKNVADFIDPEIEEKLDALEREEERLIAEGFYESDMEMDDEETEAINEAAQKLKLRKDAIIAAHQQNRTKSRATLTNKDRARSSRLDEFETHLAKIGNKGTLHSLREKSKSRVAKRSHSQVSVSRDRSKSLSGRIVNRDRSQSGLRNIKQKLDADKMKKDFQKAPNLMAKRGEADRQIQTKMPKHLFAGKRSMGKANHR
ncbi:Nucleolar GTP-binding protein 1 [Globomyces sp. JEL0801]|nr:Nucleolar GTP-binding protein 1 [Globomyces sp. JEL0801]